MTRWSLSSARQSVAVAGLALGVAGSAACTAVVDGESNPGGPTGAGADNPLGTGGSGSTPGTGGTGSMPKDAPGYKAIHRLNATEYNATVADVLGTSLKPANGAWMVYEINGFDNMAAVQHVSTDDFQQMFDAAGTLADDAFGRADFKSKFVTCATSDDACVTSIISKLGLRLFRRPVADGEMTNLKGVYAAAQGQGENHEGAIKQVLRTLLASAEFLYRMEFDASPTSGERHALTSYELASRLSYFLWSSAPDESMLAAAADDSLSKDETLKSTITRLLADKDRSDRFVESFYGQWLGARRVSAHAVASDVYKTWTPTLADGLAKEMYAYFAEFLRTDRSYAEFLTADLNFVNGEVAQLYGMPAPADPSQVTKVAVTSDQRVGFLGLGGFLAQSSLNTRTSPTLRGRWIMINLLCQHPPAPPADVPKIESAAGMTDLSKGNVRAVLEKHRANPSCAACHQLFDPYGLPLEQFDGIGAFRTTYGDGSAIVPETNLMDGTKVTGLSEIANALSKEPRFMQCVADNMFGYGLGRVVTEGDRDVLNTIQQTWNADVPSIRRLVESIALDPAFRSRSGQPL